MCFKIYKERDYYERKETEDAIKWEKHTVFDKAQKSNWPVLRLRDKKLYRVRSRVLSTRQLVQLHAKDEMSERVVCKSYIFPNPAGPLVPALKQYPFQRRQTRKYPVWHQRENQNYGLWPFQAGYLRRLNYLLILRQSLIHGPRNASKVSFLIF